MDNIRVQTILFFFLLLILAFAFQGNRGIYSPDEGYYVSIAQSMLATGNFLVPTLNGEIWLDKPPLSMWGIAAGLWLFSKTEFGARAFIAFCFSLTVIIVYFLGAAIKGYRYGFLSGIIYATMVLPFISLNICTPDTPLTLFTTSSFLFFWLSIDHRSAANPIWKLLMIIALGLGFLTKGPAVLIPLTAIIVFLLIQKRFFSYFRSYWFFPAILLFLLIGFSWYIYIAAHIPGSLSYFIDNQIWGRTVSHKYSRNSGLVGMFIYLPTILVGALPWSVLWYRKCWNILTRFRESWSKLSLLQDNPSGLLLALWIVLPFFVFSLARSRLPLYILPIFPAISLATANELIYFLEYRKLKQPTGRSQRLLLILGGWICIILLLKFTVSFYPNRNDMRDLSRAIQPYIPKNNYEIVSIDMHLEGLSFYLNSTIEPLTTSETPYPFFVLPEKLKEELKEVKSASKSFIFICNLKSTRGLREFLIKSQVPFREYPLPYQRHLFVTE
jgi:4-amino-4-deoxy-L-arabinose transferase-like glycosyltransferase